jgi:hypothetical protein
VDERAWQNATDPQVMLEFIFQGRAGARDYDKGRIA